MLLDMLTSDSPAKHHIQRHDTPQQLASSSCAPSNGSFLTHILSLSLINSLMRKQPALPAPKDSLMTKPDAPIASPTAIEHPKNPSRAATASPDQSRPPSSSSTASAEGRPKRRGARAKTAYNLAQPPPIKGRHKLHIRPKIVLQLHQVIASRRPKPVYEVIPYSLLAPRSTRRLARTFNTKGKLGPQDLLVVKTEEYGSGDKENSDDERWGKRDVIGIICPGRKIDKEHRDKTELLLGDGSTWEMTNLPTGGYEFSRQDEHGLIIKARWVPKAPLSRRLSTLSGGSQLQGDEKKFNFSTISANSRRHPVIASMTRASIEVLDSYNMPTAASPQGPQTPAQTPSSELGQFFDTLPVQTDDALRKFIVVSGIWVGFSEQWFQHRPLKRTQILDLLDF